MKTEEFAFKVEHDAEVLEAQYAKERTSRIRTADTAEALIVDIARAIYDAPDFGVAVRLQKVIQRLQRLRARIAKDASEELGIPISAFDL